MVTFSFRKFIKSVESHYATCESYRDYGRIEQRSGSGAKDESVWTVVFKTEFDRHGLFRFEWRDQTDIFTQHFPNAENVVWANKYGAFGRFDFEENTHHFLDLAQALEACSSTSSGVAPLVATMLYPELRSVFDRPASQRRPSQVKMLGKNKRQVLSVVWQSAGGAIVTSRQILFDLGEFTVLEIYDTVRKLNPLSDDNGQSAGECLDGVLGHYLSTAGRGAADQSGDIVASTRIVFENVRMQPSSRALLPTSGES